MAWFETTDPSLASVIQKAKKVCTDKDLRKNEKVVELRQALVNLSDRIKRELDELE